MRPPGVLDLAPGIIAGYLPIVLVVVVVLGAALYAVRSRSVPRQEAIRTTALDLALGLWLALTFCSRSCPSAGPAAPADRVGPIPRFDPAGRGRLQQRGDAASDIVLNVIAFMPLGVIAALRWGRRWMTLAIVGAAALSTGIELAQYIEATGRFSSATDVVTNTAGAALGFAIGLWLRDRSEA